MLDFTKRIKFNALKKIQTSFSYKFFNAAIFDEYSLLQNP
jgi:hypothetical protein